MSTGWFQVGETHATWSAIRSIIQEWSVIDHFSFRVGRKDAQYGTYVCQEPTCVWEVKAKFNDEQVWEIYDIHEIHNCLHAGITSRSVVNSQTWLRKAIPGKMVVNKDTSAKQIQDCICLHYNEQVSYQAANTAKSALVQDDIWQHREAFRKLPHYITRLREVDVDYVNPNEAEETPILRGHFHLALENNHRFQRIFICPRASQSCFVLCRRLLAIDGTFLTGKFVMTLLLAVGIDANGHNTLLAWAVVESENASSWKYFLDHPQIALLQMKNEPLVIISDRDKGLNGGNVHLGLSEEVLHVNCCHHIKENMIKGRGGQALSPFFWAVARAKTATKFAYHMQKLRDISPSAANYLQSIDSHLYAEAFVPQTRFGHDTRNIVESMNAVLKMDRQVDIVELLSRIWDRVMSMRFNRFSAASQLLFQDRHTWTPYCAQLLWTSREFAGGCRIQMSTRDEAKVRTPTDKVYWVTLDREAKSCICSCKRPQQKLVPCGHVLAVLFDQKIEIASFMPSCYEVHTWYRQYTKPMPVVMILDLTIQGRCDPPNTRMPRGRPRKERIRPGGVRGRRGLARDEVNQELQYELAVHRNRPHCSTCGLAGHNQTTCRRSHI